MLKTILIILIKKFYIFDEIRLFLLIHTINNNFK